MTTEQFNQLDNLMDELRSHLGHRCCVVTGPHDGYVIGIYDNKSGELLKQVMSYSTEDCASRLPNHPQP